MTEFVETVVGGPELRGMRILGLDHVVLTVADLEATVEFYRDALGMRLVAFDNGRKALTFGKQKINLHERGKEFEPKARHPLPGSADICLISDTGPEELVAHFRSKGIAIEAGPVKKIGALGPMTSVYVRDPDGNLVEISNYGEW